MWWNVENLFDTTHDSGKNDHDFTPDGKLNWTPKKLLLKEMRIRYLINSVRLDREYRSFPDIIAFAETENKAVFDETLSGLHGVSYESVYHDSDDIRGIDVALAYNPARVRLLSTKAYTVPYPKLRTRKIVVAGFIAGKSEFHLVLNHWPSRAFDAAWSEPKRLAAAGVARHVVDSLRTRDPMADIMVMGDFNDESDDRSLTDVLGAVTDAEKFKADPAKQLLNCWYNQDARTGSYSFRGKWQRIDHILLSAGMTDKKGVWVEPDGFRCFSIPNMLDRKGKKTWATYEKRKYKGGYSDHLPLLLRVECETH